VRRTEANHFPSHLLIIPSTDWIDIHQLILYPVQFINIQELVMVLTGDEVSFE